MRETPLYYGHQWIFDEDVEAVEKVLKGDYLTCGPEITALENDLADITGARYAVAVSSGTAALHCACIAAGIGPGDEVITTPLTFAASANCVRYCGGTVVFADVDPETYNISPAGIENAITDKTKAVIAVDYTGQAVEYKEIKEICEKHNLILIEDAAHSMGTRYDGRPIGSLADMTCFSFHPVKTVTSGEGGAITTNSKELYEKLVLSHTHGITHKIMSGRGEDTDAPWYYEEVSMGFNYRMTDLQAALLRSQLKKLDFFKQRRREICEFYNKAFEGMEEIIPQKVIAESDTCWHLYVMRLNLGKLKGTRREFFDEMRENNIFCQVHYIPVYWFPYYEDLGYKRGLCPNAEEVYRSIISLPLYPAMSDQDMSDVAETVKMIIRKQRVK